MVKAKKKFGQHFLINSQIAKKIVQSLDLPGHNIIEIGPGTGALTEHIINIPNISIYLIDIDLESINYLKNKFNITGTNILHADFLNLDIKALFNFQQVSIIGNFPYNISTQIVFKVLENYNFVEQVVGTFQYEVAERIVSSPNKKFYGITSVFTQLYYNAKMLFAIDGEEFYPKPKVRSAVIKLDRKKQFLIKDADLDFFKTVVKTAFSHRRKTLKNNFKQFNISNLSDKKVLNLRAENLSVDDYVKLAMELKLANKTN